MLRVGPESSMTIVLKEEKNLDRHVGRVPCDNRGRNWSDAPGSQKAQDCWQPWKLEKRQRKRDGFFLRASKSNQPCQHLAFRLLASCKRINFCCFKLLSLWQSNMAAPGNEYSNSIFFWGNLGSSRLITKESL